MTLSNEEGTLFISKTRPTAPADADYAKFPFWTPRAMRFWLCLLLAFGYTTIVMQKLNMGIGMVCMVNSTWLQQQQYDSNQSVRTSSDVNVSANCQLNEHKRKQYEGPFDWDYETQGMLFSAPYFGALIFCVIGGWLSDRYGAFVVLLIANIMGLLGNIVTPVAALYAPLSVIIGSRFVVGIGQGLFFPAVNRFVADWYPAFEMSTVIAFWTAGNQLSILILHPIAPLLCSAKHILGGWSLIFIGTSVLSVIWVLLWSVLVTSNPHKNRFVSDKEKQFLLVNNSKMNNRKAATEQIPWKSIFSSTSVWAIMLSNVSFSLVFFTMQVYTPTYFRDVLKFDLQDNGLISVVPFLCGLVGKFIFSIFADKLKQTTNISHSLICRAFNTFGSGTAVCSLALLAVLDCEHSTYAVVVLCIFYSATACAVPGFLTSTVTVAPQYTGIIASLGQVSTNIGGLCGPYLIGTLGTLLEWRLVFFIMCGVLAICTVFFAVFGRAEPEEWSMVLPKKEEEVKS